MAGYCKEDNEISSATKYGDLLDYLRNWLPVKLPGFS